MQNTELMYYEWFIFQCLLIFTLNIDSVKLSLLSVLEGGIGRFSRQILQEKFVCRFRRITLFVSGM